MPDSELGTFNITNDGRDLLRVTQAYSGACLLVQFRLHGNVSVYDDFVPFESMLELTKQGWTFVQRAGSRKLPSYKRGERKVWYFHNKVCGQYLKVLLLSEKLFSLGLQEIYHYQATQYYKSLLLLMKYPEQLNTVKPWQTHTFYKVLQQKSHNRRVNPNANTFDMETEDAGGLNNYVVNWLSVFFMSQE